MTHEFIEIITHFEQAKAAKIPCALATVVSLEGSAYRRPGVRMLLLDNGAEFGAVSGGCVEKEVRQQAREVFETGVPRMMTYDGRYRLGCEGILHILIEPFQPSDDVLKAFWSRIRKRISFKCTSFYQTQDGSDNAMGTVLQLDNDRFSLRPGFQPLGEKKHLTLELPPRMRLVIFGGEHDAVSLSGLAAAMGWEVIVVVAADEAKAKESFPGVSEIKSVIPETADLDFVDAHCAVVVMTHSYVKDLKYLLRLSEKNPEYLGILGPAKRRERLLGDLMERNPELKTAFADSIYGPAGLDIGSETSQEIAVSILAEILSVFRKVDPESLRKKKSAIHPQQ